MQLTLHPRLTIPTLDYPDYAFPSSLFFLFAILSLGLLTLFCPPIFGGGRNLAYLTREREESQWTDREDREWEGERCRRQFYLRRERERGGGAPSNERDHESGELEKTISGPMERFDSERQRYEGRWIRR